MNSSLANWFYSPALSLTRLNSKKPVELYFKYEYPNPMNQKIAGYHTDSENHWVAELECGHNQHVRHDPPWMVREWVITPEGRESRIGVELNCVRCDEAGLAVAKAVATEIKKQVLKNYEDAGISGLCEEGRIEMAVGSIDTLNLQPIIDEALKALKPTEP